MRPGPTPCPSTGAVSAGGRKGDVTMLDLLYVGLIVGFLALSWGLVELCDRL